MKQRIIFIDIDRTIFDAELFLQDFYKELTAKFGLNDEDIDEIKNIYKDVKNKTGYFAPNLFLEKITNSFSNISPGDIENLFWGDLIQKHLYPDSDALLGISNTIKIGIFSKGDEKFQKKKIEKFSEQISEDNIHIFEEKIDKLEQLLKDYKDFEIYFVDDSMEVLEKAKELNPAVFTILIDRKQEKEKNDKINASISSLSEISKYI